ncbi:restriction endonuclease subunit S [Pseudomonas sp. M30-35]|uniref:restriction endonuclease subunit S n=1 Tax=Pseudomonas sp. M30-35 TaxID=1981174 RepID=UPI000B3CED7F|nr:restriction endonuclease subunit S [Pseudomonas sp. M30-35]ARU87322.1 restriction endonuclease subunit S [Pseudomonas sp. M30-35]
MSGFKPYPAYKDSGVEWLGEVPEGWTVIALKWLSPVFRGASPRPIDDPVYFDDDGEFGWVRIADVTASPDGYLYETTQKLSALGSSLSVKLEPGELFLSIAGSVGKPCITAIKACIHDGFVYFPWLSIDQRLLYRVFESGLCFGGLGKMGTQLNLNTDTVGGICIAVPPAAELSRALAFLDHETARIDALIEEQQRLIELLKEKRQAVISHAVTKGLDPTVPMKDSGVEWLGEVPAHWVVGPLRWYATIQGGIAKGKDYEGRETVSLPYLRVANVQSGFVDLTEVKEISVLESEIGRYSLRSGDVLMNEGGDNDKLGRGTVWQGQIEPCLHQNHVFAIRPNDLLSAEWLTAFTQCDQARSYFFLNSKQSTNLASISASNVMSLALPIPSVAEQKEILSRLNQSRVAHEELVNLATSTVEFLKERRSALISAAVTGKIDVRGWQPPAKAQAPELEQEAV